MLAKIANEGVMGGAHARAVVVEIDVVAVGAVASSVGGGARWCSGLGGLEVRES